MSDSEKQPIDPQLLQGSAREFYEYCVEEGERRRDSGEPFDEDQYEQAVQLVLRRLQNMEQEGTL